MVIYANSTHQFQKLLIFLIVMIEAEDQLMTWMLLRFIGLTI